MGISIEVCAKYSSDECQGWLNRGEKAAISRKVRKLGFDTERDGNTIIVEGAYYGEAVEAINELGYQTDEDEITEE